MTSFVYDPAVYEGTNASLTSAVSADGWPEIGKRYRIPPRCGVAVRLRKGQVLSVENTHGTQVCDFWAYLAADMGQFLSMSHCRTWLQSVSPKIGDILVTNRRQPLLEITKDTSPVCMIPSCLVVTGRDISSLVAPIIMTIARIIYVWHWKPLVCRHL